MAQGRTAALARPNRNRIRLNGERKIDTIGPQRPSRVRLAIASSPTLPPHKTPACSSKFLTYTNRIFDPCYIQNSGSKQIVGQPQYGPRETNPVSYTHLRAHETGRNLVC